MRIAIVGASGFIGGHLAGLLAARGHGLRLIGRAPAVLSARFPGHDHRTLPRDDAGWAGVLEGIDAVVWAAGTLAAPDLDAVHARLPAACAAAARSAGVQRAVYVSAIGAAADAATAFLRTKAAGEAAWLAERRPGWTVLRPSLVYGPGGTSAALLAAMASLPVRVDPGGGTVRPIAVADVAAAIAAAVECRHPMPPVIDAVGPDAVDIAGYSDALGRRIGVGWRPVIRPPGGLVAVAARAGGRLGLPLIGPDTLAMLRRGADGDPGALTAATGVRPAGLADGMARAPAAPGERMAAYAAWLMPLLRLSLVALWLGSGVVSLASYRLGMEMLAGGGVTGSLASALLVAGAVWDLVLGLALLLGRRVAAVAGLQIVTVLAYTALASVLTPDAWAHPFAPLLKNVPILAATALVAALHRR